MTAASASSDIPEVRGVSTKCKRRRSWIAAYEDRIAAGLERCRECGTGNQLSVARLRFDRDWWLSNLTILCAEHGREYYATFQPYRRRRLLVDWRYQVPSLFQEEKARPAPERWGQIALAARRRAARRRGSDLGDSARIDLEEQP